MAYSIALQPIAHYSEVWVLIDAVLVKMRELAEEGHIQISLHASKRSSERGIPYTAIRESIAGGEFTYLRHEPGERGFVTVRIKCRHARTGAVFTVQLAVTPGLDRIFVLSVWD